MAQAKQTQNSVLTFRVLLLALIPALMIFIAEEMTRPLALQNAAQQGAIANVPSPAPAVDHIYARADQEAMLKLTNQSQRIEQDFNQYLAVPLGNASEAACMSGMRTGISAYLTPILARLHDEIAVSNYMRNEEDERFVNGNIIKTAAATMTAMPAMYDTLKRTASNCPNNAAVIAKANEIRGFLIQVSRTLQTVETPGTKVAQATTTTVTTPAPATATPAAAALAPAPMIVATPAPAAPAPVATAAPMVVTTTPATQAPAATSAPSVTVTEVTSTSGQNAPADTTAPVTNQAGPIVQIPSANTAPATGTAAPAGQ